MQAWKILSYTLAALPLALSSPARAGQVSLVTLTPVRARPETASGASAAWQLSLDGRYLLFASNAANLVNGQVDANGGRDLFLFDRVTGVTTLVTHKAGAGATAANLPISDYDFMRMTPDGRYVAFESSATDLVAGTGHGGLFLYDRVTGTTVLVNHKAGSATAAPNGAVETGRFGLTDGGSVVYVSNASDLVSPSFDPHDNSDVFFWDRASGKTSLITRAAGTNSQAADSDSSEPEVSPDGRYVAFSSSATNLVAGPRLTGYNVFLHDRATGKAVLVSHASSSPTTPANNPSHYPLVSAGGTWVLFSSYGSNLVPGQGTPSVVTNNVYLYERAQGKITLVSHASTSPTTPGNNHSESYLMTPDGAWIAFTSQASNLVAGQTETVGWGNRDVFLFERATGRITLASRTVGSPLAGVDNDALLAGLSADGRFVTFATPADNLVAVDANQASDAFVFDRLAGKATLVSAAAPGTPGNFASSGPALSADGNWIAYTTDATNLVAGKRDGNSLSDVVLYERPAERSRLVSLHAPGMPSRTPVGQSLASDVSADGRYSVFTSGSTLLVPGLRDTNSSEDVFLYDRTLGRISLVSRSAAGPNVTGDGRAYVGIRISADGRFVVYQSSSTNVVPGQVDANTATEGGSDVFLFDRAAGTTVLVSHAAASAVTTGDGVSGFPSISADGAWIVFTSAATDLVAGQTAGGGAHNNAYLYERATGRVSLLSHRYGAPDTPANDDTYASGLSADGQVALLSSYATDLIPLLSPNQDENQAIDAFVLDRSTGITTLVSRTAGDTPRAVGALDAFLSADGGTIAFLSEGDGVVSGQIGSETENLFLQDRRSGVTRLVSHAADSALTTTSADRPVALSADGRWVAFVSDSDHLVAGQTDDNRGSDIFLYDRDSGANRLVSHMAGSATTTGDGFDTQGTSMSADGRFVSFVSRSTNLIAGQTGPSVGPRPANLFVFDRTTGAVTLATHSLLGPARGGNDDTFPGIVSAGGSVILFGSLASDLVPGDLTVDPYGQSWADVFLYTLP